MENTKFLVMFYPVLSVKWNFFLNIFVMLYRQQISESFWRSSWCKKDGLWHFSGPHWPFFIHQIWCYDRRVFVFLKGTLDDDFFLLVWVWLPLMNFWTARCFRHRKIYLFTLYKSWELQKYSPRWSLICDIRMYWIHSLHELLFHPERLVDYHFLSFLMSFPSIPSIPRIYSPSLMLTVSS